MNATAQERWLIVRNLAVAGLVNAESVGKLLDISTREAEELVAAWIASGSRCPECGQELPGPGE